MTLETLNAMSAGEAERDLLRCCGSRVWARAMAAIRPFATAELLHRAADAAMDALDYSSWLEAFAAHPRIGQPEASDGATADWTVQEQSTARRTAEDTAQRLRTMNRAYDERFGYIFIINATGKSGDEILREIERRMKNDPGTELRTAAAEQRAITHLRLARLLEA